MELTKNINKNIFREYDIRGKAGIDITEDISYTIGASFGTYIKQLNKQSCIIGHDNRLSSPVLTDALIKGIVSTGINVINIGLVTTPMFYYASIKLNVASGIMVTASHNPKDENGFKITFDERGNARGKMIEDFYNFTINGKFMTGEGTVSNYNIRNDYFKLFDNSLDFPQNNLKVVIDPGNGTTSIIAEDMYKRFIKNVIPINNVSDGTFPNHHPDPSVESNLDELKAKVKSEGADLGVAFDGDGDRVGFILNDGSYMPIDKFMIIIIRDLIKKVENKTFLYDVKCSKALKDEIIKLGGRPYEYRTGSSYTKTKTKEMDLAFGGELAGHVYFRDHFPGFDSGLYAGLRLLEILARTGKKAAELLEGIEEYKTYNIDRIDSTDEEKHKLIEKVKEYAISKNYKFSLIDGIKIYFNDSWILLRASNTGPSINGRIEAKTEEEIKRLYNEFMGVLKNEV